VKHLQKIFLIEHCRLLVVIRMIVLGFFLAWRIRNPNRDAMWLWGMSIVCEVWFAFSWLLDILPKLNPINRATDLAALHDKFDQPSPSNPSGRSDLPGVDVFVSTADPEKEPPLVTANTILSILAADYPIEKLSCYMVVPYSPSRPWPRPFTLLRFSYYISFTLELISCKVQI